MAVCPDCGRRFPGRYALRSHRARAVADARRRVAVARRYAEEHGLVPCPNDTHLFRICRVAGLAQTIAHECTGCRVAYRVYIPGWAEPTY